jgi:retinol dehydrogenase-14
MSVPALNADLSGKVAVVTGASSGIGKEITRGLAAQGALVVMACRNLAKAEAVKAELQAGQPQAKLLLMQLDLSSLSSVRAFAAAFMAGQSKLDILVNNAGGWTGKREVSVDGQELTWVTNVVGPELLTRLLLPALKAAGKARIVNVASTAAGNLDLNDIQYVKRKYDPIKAYSQTKQANRMLTWALNEGLPAGLTANAMSPGLVKTDLNRDAPGFFKVMFKVLLPLMGKTPAQGADTAVWLASAPELEGVTNKFYENRKELACKFRADTAAIKALVEDVHRTAGI